MIALLRKWVLTSVPLVFAVSVLTFVLTSLVPGDAARSILGVSGTPEQYERLRLELGLDDPLPTQYWNWLWGALHGDFGHSVATRDSVAHQLTVRLGVTLWLIAGAVVVAAVIGIALGVAGALRTGVVGKLVDVGSLAGSSIPSYWLGLLLAYAFAVRWHIFPATGYVPFADSSSDWFKSLALPVLTLGIASSAPIAKQTRNGVLAELDKPYVAVLRARGVRRRSIVLKHVLRNASAPVVTVLGLVVVGLLSGTVLVETLFVLPGLGGLAVTSTAAHDIPVVQGVAVVFTIIIVLVNLVMELIYAAHNPRVRT